jgi:uncharacterized membrane protein
VLLDADDEFPKQDKSALSNFPATLEELNNYDVLIIGDCDPNHNKLKNHLKDIYHFVIGEDEKGRKGSKPGGGLLFMAGALNNPHRFKGTLLEKVMPVEPLQDQPPADKAFPERMKLKLTDIGQGHPIFRFSPDRNDNLRIWENNVSAIYWYSTGYRPKPLAEVLAVHPSQKAAVKDALHPLVVQQYVGSGRSMFFGFDETWRWRKGDDEPRYINFWIQTMRYLSRGRSTRTELTLNQQTPYRLGEPIKVTVSFPENVAGGGADQAPKITDKTEVKVSVAYIPPDVKDTKGEKGELESHTLQLAKVHGSTATFEGTWTRTREGKYRFRLTHPDVSAAQPDGEKPSAEATVVLPPGELDNLRMNSKELMLAADATQGKFYTLVNADQLLEELPAGVGPTISAQVPPELLWNHWLVFMFVLFLISSEWVLRKLKHLL